MTVRRTFRRTVVWTSAGQGADKTADRRTLTGDRVNKPFLPSYVPLGAGRKDG